ncbi:phytanoyl-CoA dioxygenase family protein [Pleurocapsales cyanobacterium LEGE 06147]|nr:phytanoyl-CoA dioxygenase family protein [Pleurocapsales cyanobacterium LEGE 06147]
MSSSISDYKSFSNDDSGKWSSEKYPSLDEPKALKEFFDEEGYIVIRNAIPKSLCRAATNAFLTEVKPKVNYFFLRHESGTSERHVFTKEGFMKYPIMNIQDLRSKSFQSFRQQSLNLLTHDTIRRTIGVIFGTAGQLIHTMYFDGNQQTWAHRDSNYIDSEEIGSMVGVWVAAEDIHPGAGRFYVYPGSHRLQLPWEQADLELDPNGRNYKEGMKEYLKTSGLKRVAPALRQGDLLLWSSRVIHGSLETTDPRYSRRSFTAHYIPESHNFIWFHKYKGSKESILVNGVKVALHRDQTKWWLQMRYRIKQYFPGVVRLAAGMVRRWR